MIAFDLFKQLFICYWTNREGIHAFFHKNTLYKNIEAEIGWGIKGPFFFNSGGGVSIFAQNR